MHVILHWPNVWAGSPWTNLQEKQLDKAKSIIKTSGPRFLFSVLPPHPYTTALFIPKQTNLSTHSLRSVSFHISLEILRSRKPRTQEINRNHETSTVLWSHIELLEAFIYCKFPSLDYINSPFATYWILNEAIPIQEHNSITVYPTYCMKSPDNPVDGFCLD